MFPPLPVVPALISDAEGDFFGRRGTSAANAVHLFPRIKTNNRKGSQCSQQQWNDGTMARRAQRRSHKAKVGFILHTAEMGMGPLTGELQPGKGGEMGLFPPKCFGGNGQEPGMPKPGTSRWCGGISGASRSWMGRGSQKWGALLGNGRKREAVYFQYPESISCSGGQ